MQDSDDKLRCTHTTNCCHYLQPFSLLIVIGLTSLVRQHRGGLCPPRPEAVVRMKGGTRPKISPHIPTTPTIPTMSPENRTPYSPITY
jgi:hypothetical protein